MKRIVIVLALLYLCLALLSACSSASPTTAASTSSSSGNPTTVSDGKTLLDTRCSICHTTAKVASEKGNADQWKRVVDDMIQKGAVLTPEEETILVQYLADNFK